MHNYAMDKETRMFVAFILVIRTDATTAAPKVCEKSLCHYDFNIQAKTAMTFGTSSGTVAVSLNDSRFRPSANDFTGASGVDNLEIDESKVISLDGIPRDVITINEQFPGPTIEVMEGSQVEIVVSNNLFTEAITIHWHGIYQTESPLMDGVPHITQHPILPGNTFTYKFLAYPPGTHWYHSHLYNQRLDGLFGMLVVHRTKPELPYHVVSIMDWYHTSARHLKVVDPFHNHGTAEGYLAPEHQLRMQDGVAISSLAYVSGLINGKGRYNNMAPLSEFIVESDKGNLFMVCHTGAEFSFEISVDEHKLFLTNSQDSTIDGINVDFMLIFPGECYNFILQPKRNGTFWLRAKTLQDTRAGNVSEINAIIRSGASNDTDIAGHERLCTSGRQCVVFNCPFKGYAAEFYRRCVHVDSIKAKNQTRAISKAHSETIFLNFGFHIGSSVNGHQWRNPTAPIFCSAGQQTDECPSNCTSGCYCPYTITIPSNTQPNLVLSSLQSGSSGHHSIHIHGHSFQILRIVYPEFNTTTGHWTKPTNDLRCIDKLCSKMAWNDSPPNTSDYKNLVLLKDTVVVPANGYVIARLWNPHPGYWMMHCHQELHMEEGMMLMVHVEGDLPPANESVLEWACPLNIQAYFDLSSTSAALLLLLPSVSVLLFLFTAVSFKCWKSNQYQPLLDDTDDANNDDDL